MGFSIIGVYGKDGADGTPGKPGAPGKTSYVHMAYANSADGKTGFSTSYFAGALYLGTYTDYDVNGSTSYASYTWVRLMGDSGEPAYSLQLTPSVLSFDADADGLVSPALLAANTCRVRVLRGSEELTPTSVTLDYPVRCTARHNGNGVVQITAVSKDTGTGMAYGSGYVTVTATADGKTFTGKLYWSVNIHKVAAKMIADGKQLGLNVDALTRKGDEYQKTTNARILAAEEHVQSAVTAVDNMGTRMTRFEQDSESIKLFVENQRAGVENLLTGGQMNQIFGFYGLSSSVTPRAKLKQGHTYTLTVSGRASKAALDNGRILRVQLFNDAWTFYPFVDFNSTDDEVKWVTFTTPADMDVQVNAYPYPEPASGDLSNVVAWNWAVLTEGNIPAASFFESKGDIKRRTGFDLIDGAIDTFADKFTLRNNSGEKTLSVDEDGNGVFAGVVKAVNFYQNIDVVTPESAGVTLGSTSGGVNGIHTIDRKHSTADMLIISGDFGFYLNTTPRRRYNAAITCLRLPDPNSTKWRGKQMRIVNNAWCRYRDPYTEQYSYHDGDLRLEVDPGAAFASKIFYDLELNYSGTSSLRQQYRQYLNMTTGHMMAVTLVSAPFNEAGNTDRYCWCIIDKVISDNLGTHVLDEDE